MLIRAVKEECGTTTCKHGGTCTEIATGRHICTCPVGYRGENCEGECQLEINVWSSFYIINSVDKTTFFLILYLFSVGQKVSSWKLNFFFTMGEVRKRCICPRS